jgi:hypothetical protein
VSVLFQRVSHEGVESTLWHFHGVDIIGVGAVLRPELHVVGTALFVGPLQQREVANIPQDHAIRARQVIVHVGNPILPVRPQETDGLELEREESRAKDAVEMELAEHECERAPHVEEMLGNIPTLLFELKVGGIVPPTGCGGWC